MWGCGSLRADGNALLGRPGPGKHVGGVWACACGCAHRRVRARSHPRPPRRNPPCSAPSVVLKLKVPGAEAGRPVRPGGPGTWPCPSPQVQPGTWLHPTPACCGCSRRRVGPWLQNLFFSDVCTSLTGAVSDARSFVWGSAPYIPERTACQRAGLTSRRPGSA